MNNVTFQLVLQLTALTCSRKHKSQTTQKLELDPTFMVGSPHLFAAQVVQKFNVTGMKRLPCVHWHQDHLVSNYHLHPKHQTVTKTNTRLYGRHAVFKATGVHAWCLPKICKHPSISNKVPCAVAAGVLIRNRTVQTIMSWYWMVKSAQQLLYQCSHSTN